MSVTLTATDQVQLPDGLYEALLTDIKEVPGDLEKTPYFAWIFWVTAPEYPTGVELRANSSTRFGPRAKARRWFMAALGRPIERGEVINTGAVLPLRCRVFTKMDEDTGFIRIEDVVKSAMLTTPPATPPVDGVFV